MGRVPVRQATCQGNMAKVTRASSARHMFVVILETLGAVGPFPSLVREFLLGVRNVVLRQRIVVS